MSKEPKAKKEKKWILVRDKEKHDKRMSTYEIVRDGSNDEVVLAGVYNPDQMARCLNEMLILTSLREVNEPGEGIHKASESRLETTEKPKDNTDKRDRKKLEIGAKSKEPKESRFLVIDDLKDCQAFREAASRFIAENIVQRLEEFYFELSKDAITSALDAVSESMEKRGEKKPSRQELNSVLNRWIMAKRIGLGLPAQNRPRGREGFRNCKNFMKALKQVLSKTPNKPGRILLWQMLRQHELYNGKEEKKTERPSRDSARTLDGWLHDCGIKNIDEAIELYWGKPLAEE